MKYLSLLILLYLMTSCVSPAYYQVFKVEADEAMLHTKEELAYENEHCKITYDLWGASGDIGFLFFNKSSHTIYLHKEETFYVQNGIANNYYKNRTVTNSFSQGISSQHGNNVSASVARINSQGLAKASSSHAFSGKEVANSMEYAVSVPEEMIIAIPSQTAKYVSEYHVKDFVFLDCDLPRYPRRDSVSLSFGLTNTPFSFENRITYEVGKEGELQNVNNEFYVSSIINYPANEMIKSTYKEECGRRVTGFIQVFRFTGPDMFYVKYHR